MLPFVTAYNPKKKATMKQSLLLLLSSTALALVCAAPVISGHQK
jgi:hypothetical protein